MEVLAYQLPDAVMFREGEPEPGWLVWVPDHTCLVLGASNQPEVSLYPDRVERDQIPVYKRPSGGETVILTPNTLVISVRLPDPGKQNPNIFFKQINHLIINALQNAGVDSLGQRGISDIAIGEKKILGSSIYRKREMVFYHAVLNLSEPAETIGRYIRHPKREPDYRRGRDHAEFVTSLSEAGYSFSPESIATLLEHAFQQEKLFDPLG